MKKRIIYVILILLCVPFVSCGMDSFNDTDISENSNSYELCVSYGRSVYDTIDEAVESIIQLKDTDEELKSAFKTRNLDSYNFTVYTFAGIPEDYDLWEVYQAGAYISMNYYTEPTDRLLRRKGRNESELDVSESIDVSESRVEPTGIIEPESSIYESSESTNESNIPERDIKQITFVWRFSNAAGTDIYLKKCAAAHGLIEFPDMPGYYYAGARDDNMVDVYLIYWIEDGCSFQLNIPVELFDAEYRGKPEMMALKKLTYPLGK